MAPPCSLVRWPCLGCESERDVEVASVPGRPGYMAATCLHCGLRWLRSPAVIGALLPYRQGSA